MRIIESQKEMGAPYPQHRGGANLDGRTIVHPEWPPRAPTTLAPAVEHAARAFDRITPSASQ